MAKAPVKKALTTERQSELNRVILECFDEFDRRGQSYYGLDGMTTAHITVHAIQDFTTLKAFWPKDLVQHRLGQTVYCLEDDTMSKVQSAVRSSLEQLVEKGWVERIGNEHERRWRPIREKLPETKPALDPDGNVYGEFTKIDGKWQLT
jgi:hypothetical protein